MAPHRAHSPNAHGGPEPQTLLQRLLFNRVGGFFFMFVLWWPSFAGPLCYLFPLYFLVLYPKALRAYYDWFMATYFYVPVILMEFVMGIKFVFSGDMPPLPSESCIVLLNHRTMFDYLFMWVWFLKRGHWSIGRMKIVLKDALRFVPGLGWCTQLNLFMFLKRKWEQDEHRVNEILDYYCDWDYPVKLLLFPEGTDFCPKSKAASDSHAEKFHKPKYEYVLHPRTKGLTHIAKRMAQRGNLDAIYDLSIAYPKYLPQRKVDLFFGRFPEEIHIKAVRYSASDLPTTNEAALAEWCEKLYERKEEELKNFYSAKERKFNGPKWKDEAKLESSYRFYAVLFGMKWILFFIFYPLLLRWTGFQIWSLLTLIACGVLSGRGGLEQCELAIGRWWKRKAPPA